MMWLELLTTVVTGIFAGAAIYINVAEHPARMSCGTDLAATVFPASYARASAMQASLVVAGTVMALIVWIQSGQILWLVGGAIFGAIFPYTLIGIMPTNKLLKDPGIDKVADSTRSLLVKWGNLHLVRSILSLIAFLIFAYLLAQSG